MYLNNTVSKLLLALFILSFLSSLIFPSSVAADTVFEDNFNDNTINFPTWAVKNYVVEDSGSFANISELSIEESSEELKISGTGTIDTAFVDGQLVGNVGKSLILNTPLIPVDTISVESKVRVVQGNVGFQAILTIEFDEDNRISFNVQRINEGKFTQLNFDENDTNRCPVNTEDVSGCSSLPYSYNDNQVLYMRLELNPNTRHVNGFIDNNQVISGIYNGVIAQAHVGIAGTVRNVGDSIDARFDDFKVTVEGENPSPNILNAPDLKQFDPPWENLQYNHLTGRTINQVGCALTSATNILRYYNHNILPDGLNNWLINHPAGYNRAGGINWATVATFTKTNTNKIDSTKPLSHLEWKRYGVHDNSILDNQLSLNQPTILNVPGHFVIAKGKSNGDYFINDPASSSFNLLSQTENYHGGEYFKMETYTPTSTDFSYIYFLIDENFQFKVFDTDGFEINDGHATEYPITTNDTFFEPVGSTLNSFTLPKPESGLYKVEITGTGSFQLDSYLYNPEGEVNTNSHFDNLEEGETSTYYLYFDDNIQSVFPEDPSNAFDSLLESTTLAFNNNLIKDEDLYNSLNSLIRNAQRQYEKTKTFSPDILLNVALARVRFFTPSLMDEDYSQLLQTQLKLLIDSI